MKKNTECNYSESILAQNGISEIEYIVIHCDMINTKIANNIRLTPSETKFWINYSEIYLKEKK